MPLDYVNVRCMDSKEAIVSKPFDSRSFVTLKPVHEKNVPKELQVHVRFKDTETDRTWDVDAYLPLAEVLVLGEHVPKWKRLSQSLRCSTSLVLWKLRRRNR